MSNRTERRNLEKLEKKRRTWYESLQAWQRQFFDETVIAARNYRIETAINLLDVAQSGALSQLTDLTFKEIYAINMQTGEYLTELLDADSRLGTERNFNMKKYDEKILKEMETMLTEGKTKGAVAKAIRATYKEQGYTTADVNILLKQAIETVTVKKAMGDKFVETDKAVEYILSENDEVAAEVEPKVNSKFKVVYKELEVEGQYGKYTVSSGKVNGFELETHIEKHNKTRDNILEQIKNLTNTLELHECRIEEMTEIFKEFTK